MRRKRVKLILVSAQIQTERVLVSKSECKQQLCLFTGKLRGAPFLILPDETLPETQLI